MTPRLSAKLARIRLICFDVDGTLIDDEGGDANIWHAIHRSCGLPGNVNGDRFAAFLEGRITYSDWVDLDVGDWQRHGLTRADILRVVRQLRLMPGARQTVAELRRRGYKLGVISGSLDIGIETLFPDHPFNDLFINRIRFDADERIAGWEATSFDLNHKEEALRLIAEREGLSLGQCAFVGDNFNDVAVARAAGVAVALAPKCEELRAIADLHLPAPDLRPLLDYFPGPGAE